jgi:threonine synthase
MNLLLGKPLKKIIVSTNENDIIYQLIEHGYYKKGKQGDEISCASTSMVILYGSNVEKLFRLALGDEKTRNLMKRFNAGEEIQLTPEEHQKIRDLGLEARRVSREDELWTMRDVWLKHDRLICPHTANAYFSAQQYKQGYPKDKSDMLVSETASPWKFLAAVATAVSCNTKEEMSSTYALYKQKEQTKEGVQELLMIIRDAFAFNDKLFDESMIPDDVRKIYTD